MTGRKSTVRLATTLSTFAVASCLLGAAPALAQAADEPAEGTIVVTARKSGEDILKVPVTVTALTSEAIQQKGIATMVDVAASTPGININNNSSGRADRSFQQIILRGFTPSSTLATTTSMFIDGVPVSSPSQVGAISNPERIEILKGPQSAYFGRNTFAGAINVVNKVPGNDWGGEITGMVGTRDNWRLNGAVEGPIVQDLISFRITGDKFSKGGSYRNYDGTMLGSQSSTMGTALLSITPAHNLKIKVFGMMGEDSDGPASQTRIYMYDVKNAAGATVVKGQSNCVLTGDSRGVLNPTTGLPAGTAVKNNFYCGTIPNLVNPVYANVENTDAVRQFLAISANRNVSPNDGVKEYGLYRKTRHAHTTIDFEPMDGLTVSALAGYNFEVWSTMFDLDGYDSRLIAFPSNPKGYWDFPYYVDRKIEDWSLEGRVAYESGRFKGVAGVSYLAASQYQSLGGGTGALTAALLSAGGKSQADTTGLFFGLTYDLTDTISISGEGRYQIDKLGAFARTTGQTVASSAYIPAGFYAGGTKLASATYKNFTPRIIINWDVTPDMMVYASWSKGVNPAQFNTSILAQSASVQAVAQAAGGQLSILPEKITNYEFGIKGKIGNNIRYSAASYYAQWRNQINAITIVAPDPSTPTGFTFISASANSGTVDLYGIEADVSWTPTDFLTVDAAGAINETEIKKFASTTVSQLTGIFDFAGKEMKNTSKYSANIGVTLGTDIDGWDNGRWFLRGDLSYKSGQWSNEANIAKSKGRNVVNLRAGVTRGQFTIEAFMTNVFNNLNPVSIADNFTLTPDFAYAARNSALVLSLPEKRTAGVQAKVKF